MPIDSVIDSVENLEPKFLIKKYVLHYENLHLYLRLGLKRKKINCLLEFNQLKWLKSYIKFNIQHITETEKNDDKNGKLLYELMDKVLYSKTMENIRNRIDAREN